MVGYLEFRFPHFHRTNSAGARPHATLRNRSEGCITSHVSASFSSTVTPLFSGGYSLDLRAPACNTFICHLQSLRICPRSQIFPSQSHPRQNVRPSRPQTPGGPLHQCQALVGKCILERFPLPIEGARLVSNMRRIMVHVPFPAGPDPVAAGTGQAEERPSHVVELGIPRWGSDHGR